MVSRSNSDSHTDTEDVRDAGRSLRATALATLITALAATLCAASAAWLPAGPGNAHTLAVGAAVAACLAFLGALRLFVLARRPAGASQSAGSARVAASDQPSASALEVPAASGPRPAPPPKAAPAAPAAEPGSEALMLLSLLQEKGRFLDFLMEDIAGYGNEQVGAAARVVHQGCRAVVDEAFAPMPVAPAENARMVLEPGYDAGEFRLVGRTEGALPFTVKVTHKGWRARHVKLPRRMGAERIPDKPVIVPAEVAA